MFKDIGGVITSHDWIDKYNAVVAMLVLFLGAIFGQYWYLFAAFLVLNVLDWLTGWAKARKLKKESSAAGLLGIVKKLYYWVLVLLAFWMPRVFIQLGMDAIGHDMSFLQSIGWITLTMLVINELRSVVENLVVFGVQVPDIFTKGLAIAEKVIKDKSNIFPQEEEKEENKED